MKSCPYATLNIHRVERTTCEDSTSTRVHQVSDDEIREAYKRLSRLLHPDKRPPGKERDDAQEIFTELMNSYEILSDPVLRQAYDHFGHTAVATVRHNRYDPSSIYVKLSNLHQQGKTAVAKEMLTSVLENAAQERRQKEWKFDADVDLNLTVTPAESDELFDVSGTDVSFTSVIPIRQTCASASPFSNESENSIQQQMQLAIGSHTSLEKGLGSTRGTLAAMYQPSKNTHLSSKLTVGWKHVETSLSSVQHMASGTVMSAQITRTHKDKLSFGFSSNRMLYLINGRTTQAAFSLNLGFNPPSQMQIQYGHISLSTWGLWSEDDATGEDHHRKDDEQSDAQSHNSANTSTQSDRNETVDAKTDYHCPPKLTGRLAISQFPLELTIEHNHLFNSPERSIEASVSYNPFEGIFSVKTMICREVSETTSFSVGLSHVGMNGLTWMFRYHREELTLSIPIFVATFLSPRYWNKMLIISSLSYLMDEVVGEMFESDGNENLNSLDVHEKIAVKEKCVLEEQHWMDSSSAKLNSSQQLLMMESIAKVKREHEVASNGLVILNAKYTWATLVEHPSIEVTHALQFWIQNSSLVLPAQTKRILLGFYDLSHQKNHIQHDSNILYGLVDFMNTSLAYLGIGQTQKGTIGGGREGDDGSAILTIRYRYKDIAYEIEIDDDRAESLPSPNALVLGSGKHLY